VMLTRLGQVNRISETVVANVRVLAIGAQTGEKPAPEVPAPETFSGNTIATLELDPVQAEIVVGAVGLGQLTLVLRPTAEAGDPDAATQAAINQAIRMSSPFWQK